MFLASYLNQKRELLQVATSAHRAAPPPAGEAPRTGDARVGDLARVLFLQRDLGASLLYFGIFVVMLWVATGRAAYLVIGLVLFASARTRVWFAFDHVQLRVDIWLHALDPAKVFAARVRAARAGAVRDGDAAGSSAPASGAARPGLIPFASTDFIFAAIGEELGLLGTAAILLLYVALVGKGLRSRPCERRRLLDRCSRWASRRPVAIQAFVIVGGVTRVIPLTGVTLPFV